MSKQSDIVKNLVKKNVGEKPTFGTDPRDPWSTKYNVTEDAILNKYLLSKGINPKYVTKDQKVAHSKMGQFIKWKRDHAGMAEQTTEPSPTMARLKELNKSKKHQTPIVKGVAEEVDKKDTVTFDIPLLIRVLELAREDVKTDMDLHRVVERLINMRNKGMLTMDDYDEIAAIKEEVFGSTPLEYIKQALSDLKENHIAIAMGKMLDDEGSMVLNQMDDIDRCSQMVRDYIGKDYEKQLPAWVQAKITLASDYINTVGTYLASKNEDVKEAVRTPEDEKKWTKLAQSRSEAWRKKQLKKIDEEQIDEVRRGGFTAGWRDEKYFGKGVPTNRPMTDKEKAESEKTKDIQNYLNNLSKNRLKKEEVGVEESAKWRNRADANQEPDDYNVDRPHAMEPKGGYGNDRLRGRPYSWHEKGKVTPDAVADKKAAIKRSLGQHPKPNLPEDVELEEEFKKGDRVRHKDSTLGTVTREPDEHGIVSWKYAGNNHRVSHKSALKSAAGEKFRWRQNKEDVELDEARYGGDAFQKDSASSVSGFGKSSREDDEYHTPSKHYVRVQVSKGDGPKTHFKATVRAKEPQHAVSAAIAHYKKQGYTVHKHEYLGEQVEQIAEISDTTLASYKEKAKKSADTLHAQGQYKKSANRWMNVMKATGKQMSKMKFENTLDPKAATETPCDCANNPDDVAPQDKNKKLIQMSKSARIIKSIYKNKNMKEEVYDHEKEDKSVATYGKKPKMSDGKKNEQVSGEPKAAAIMSGGTTLTGTPRDTIEIDPMMKLKPGLIGQTKNNNR